MGSELIYLKSFQTWDSPCHGTPSPLGYISVNNDKLGACGVSIMIMSVMPGDVCLVSPPLMRVICSPTLIKKERIVRPTYCIPQGQVIKYTTCLVSHVQNCLILYCLLVTVDANWVVLHLPSALCWHTLHFLHGKKPTRSWKNELPTGGVNNIGDYSCSAARTPL